MRGDRYLLCSDGLTDPVDDGTIRDELARCAEPVLAARALIDVALAAGGPDNATAIVIDVVDELP